MPGKSTLEQRVIKLIKDKPYYNINNKYLTNGLILFKYSKSLAKEIKAIQGAEPTKEDKITKSILKLIGNMTQDEQIAVTDYYFIGAPGMTRVFLVGSLSVCKVRDDYYKLLEPGIAKTAYWSAPIPDARGKLTEKEIYGICGIHSTLGSFILMAIKHDTVEKVLFQEIKSSVKVKTKRRK